jgi:long-chain acyl-CoA synthetase
VSIIGDNDPEFYWAEIAVQGAGGTTIGIFADANLQELGHVLKDSDSVFVVAHDQEQCDKLLELRNGLPQVRNVIYWDEKGLWDYNNPWLMSFEQVEQLGRDYAAQYPNTFQERIAEGTGDDIAILSYTSGTTSLPKGAMIAHKNLIYGMRQYIATAPIKPTDNYVSFSPLAWITEQNLGLTTHVCNATIVNFPENATTVQNDIREIAPSSLAPVSKPFMGKPAQYGAGSYDRCHLDKSQAVRAVYASRLQSRRLCQRKQVRSVPVAGALPDWTDRYLWAATR